MRRAIFRIHLWTGLAIGLYIIVICVSGSILVYRNELYGFFAPGPDGLVPLGFRMTASLIQLHDTLWAEDIGRRINGIGALLVLLMCATGAVIWWPGRRNLRRAIRVERRAGFRRLTWTLHSALGFWFFGFLLLWAVSGAYLALPQAVQAFFDYVEPVDEASPVERIGDRIQYWLAYLHFGRLGGRGIPGCGRMCNEVTKAIWAAAGLVPPVMVVTGGLMWWTRVVKPRRGDQ